MTIMGGDGGPQGGGRRVRDSFAPTAIP